MAAALLKFITKPMKIFPITPRTMTLVLAYLHRHAVKWLPGRGTGAAHLQALARWIEKPDPTLRTLRNHQLLAAHIALLQAADLVSVSSENGETARHWLCRPTVFKWLKLSLSDQLAPFLDILPDSADWNATLQSLNLAEALPLDYAAYLKQHLQRQCESAALPEDGRTQLATSPTSAQWELNLPENLPLSTLFHLLQFGDWQPGQPWLCSPLTIAPASKRGYSPIIIQGYISQATGQPLSAEQQHQLLAWWAQATMVQVRTVTLLSTRRPEQLAEIAQNRRLQARFHQQIGPRHAIVSADLIPSLQRWLAAQNIPLDAPDTLPGGAAETTPEYTWLALQVLAGLSALIELPISIPYSELETAEARLTAEERAELDYLAQDILEGIQQAIRGRDAFFPASHPANEAWLGTIRTALNEELCLDITYQSLVDRQPYPRRVEPLRLEQRGSLYYLHAYCYLAEANRIFRLDRVHACQVVSCHTATDDVVNGAWETI